MTDVSTIVEFVNTLDIEAGEDVFTEPAILGRWLNRRGLIGREERITTDEDLKAAQRFREALRQLLTCHQEQRLADPWARQVMEEAARRAVLTLGFGAEGATRLIPQASGIDGALGRILAAAHHAGLEGERERIKVCSNDGCRWAFYDESRNYSRRWCRMEVCGNRSKVQAHRARRSA